MRPRVTDSKIIYLRFRKDLDEIITEKAKSIGRPKASVVRDAMTTYIRDLDANHHGKLDSITREDLALSPLSSSFFVKTGRAVERVLGKPMRVTLKKVDEGNMKLAALSTGYSITLFRTAIMVTWASNESLL